MRNVYTVKPKKRSIFQLTVKLLERNFILNLLIENMLKTQFDYALVHSHSFFYVKLSKTERKRFPRVTKHIEKNAMKTRPRTATKKKEAYNRDYTCICARRCNVCMS